MSFEYHVRQDGADFYLYEGSALIAVVSYPQRVSDFDMDAARDARSWFEAFAGRHNMIVHF